ncbi:hypothetical protein K3495_g4837 [Podosphaera aphanis]|nr:hypothetical protein K3495_g4837 [Podosphaera aphanis]
MNPTLWRGYRICNRTQRQIVNGSRRPVRPAQSSRRLTTAALQTHSPANGPITTLPAPLNPPARKPDQAAFTYYLSVGKAYLAFYKKGIKNIYYNYKAAKPIQHLIDSRYGGSVSSAVAAKAICRSDFQLLIRNWHDIRRVPVFGLMLLICGEFTPLIVVALSNIVPWTCRIPAQIEKDRSKRERVRRKAFLQIVPDPPAGGVEYLASSHLGQINSSLGLSSQIWNLIGGTPKRILKRRLRKRLDYLKIDDSLIEAAGGAQKMNIEEVKMALVERGVDVLSKPETQLRRDLTSWLGLRKQIPVERLLLTRPIQWPAKIEKIPTHKCRNN